MFYIFLKKKKSGKFFIILKIFYLLLWKNISSLKVKVLVAQSCLTLLKSNGLQTPRLLCPWDSPGKNTELGCHFLLPWIFLIQGSNPGHLHCRQRLLPSEPPGNPPLLRSFTLLWKNYYSHELRVHYDKIKLWDSHLLKYKWKNIKAEENISHVEISIILVYFQCRCCKW